jgi:hypothetical protein
MGITPIGPLAMLPLSRSAELAPIPRVESSPRTEDETYSPAQGDGDSQSGTQGSEAEAQDYELREDEMALENESSFTESSAGSAPSFDLQTESPAQISFFA